MSNLIQNLVILSVCWLFAAGGGIYATYFMQPDELERLEKAEQVARMKQAELASLMAEMGDSEGVANSVVTRWNARYKVVPRTLGSEEVIRFMNDHSEYGFEVFNVSFDELAETDDFNRYVFEVDGRGDFDALYELVWSIENDRQLFRIEELELDHSEVISDDPLTGGKRMDLMVSFTFELHAYFGGAVGLSASDSAEGAPQSLNFSATDMSTSLPNVPAHVLPAPRAASDPFTPLILENIPPNTKGLLDMAEATLVSIVGDRAVLIWEDEEFSVAIGDPVYLGQVISVDPREGKVIASLNKGGILERIELSMDLDQLYNQARGNVQLSPARNY